MREQSGDGFELSTVVEAVRKQLAAAAAAAVDERSRFEIGDVELDCAVELTGSHDAVTVLVRDSDTICQGIRIRLRPMDLTS